MDCRAGEPCAQPFDLSSAGSEIAFGEMSRTTVTITSVVIGLAATIASFLFLFPTGCADVGGMPSWERCTSAMGTPAFSLEDLGLSHQLDVIHPILTGLLIGLVTWGLLSQTQRTPD